MVELYLACFRREVRFLHVDLDHIMRIFDDLDDLSLVDPVSRYCAKEELRRTDLYHWPPLAHNLLNQKEECRHHPEWPNCPACRLTGWR